MTLLAVNHHYVSAEPRRGRAIFPTSVQGLRDQVQELARSFEFVSRDDVLAAVEGRRTLPERACLITFDDGLRSQVELGLGVLEELGVPAVFFICGRPLRERRALSVHKIHATREAVSEREFLALVAAEVPEHAARLDELADQAAIVYRYDTPDAACVKYLLNFALEWDTREVVADRIFASVLGDEAAFCEQLYMTAEQVTALERDHRAVGAHSYAHAPLGLLDEAALRTDLAASIAVLRELTGSVPRMVSYPYGSPTAATVGVARTSADVGFVAGFTMERALNDDLTEPLLLARVDTNDAPGGRSPLIRVDDGGDLAYDAPTRVRHLGP